MKQNTDNTPQTPTSKGRGTKQYIKPRIELIFLDSEITLALESTPPEGPGEIVYNAPMYFNTSPHKEIIS